MAPQLRSKKRPNNCNVRDNDEGCAKKRKLEDIDKTLKTTNKKSKMAVINTTPKCTEQILKKNCISIKCTVNLGGTQLDMNKLSKYKRKIDNVKPCDKSHDSQSDKPSMYIGPFVNILDDRPNEIQLKTRHLRILRLLKGKSPSSDKYNYNTCIHKLIPVLQQFHPFGIEEYIAPQDVFPSDDPIKQDLTLPQLIEQRLNALPTEGKESNLFYYQEQTWGSGNKFSLKQKCILRKKKQDFINLRTALHKRLIYRYKITNLTYIEQQFNLRNLLKNNYSLTIGPKKLRNYYKILHTYSLKIISEYCKIYNVNSLLTKQFLKKARNITTVKYKSSRKYSNDDVNENNACKILENAVEVAILDSTNKINNNAINNTQSNANLSVMEYNCNNIPYEIPRDIIDFEGNYSEEIFATKYVNDVINKYNLFNNTNFKVEKSNIYIYYKIIRNLKDFIYNYLTFRYNYFSFTNEIISYYLSNTISYEDMYIIMHIVIFSDDVASKFVSLHSTLDVFELQQCGIQLPINFSEDIDNLFQILITCFENKNRYSIHDLLILYILQCLKTEIKSMTDDLKTKIVTLMNKALKFVIEPDCDLIEITGENTGVLRLNSHLNLNSNSPIIDDYFMNNLEENLEMKIKNTNHINIETNSVHYGIENLIVSDQIGSDISCNNISDLEKGCTGDLISEFHIPINDDSYYNPAVIGNEDPSSQDENPFSYDTNMPMDNAELVSNVLEMNMNFQEISLNENENLEVIEDQVVMNDSIIAEEELDKNNTDRVATFDNIPIGFNNAGILLS